MSKVAPARRAACAVLAEAERREAYVRELLDASEAVARLERRDAAFARRLALGVTATVGCLDEALDRYLAKPRKVAPRVRTALRVAAFELLYLDAAPGVAVSQGVELVRAQAPAAAGMANAVLRRVAEGRAAYLAGEDCAEGDLRADAPSGRLCCPEGEPGAVGRGIVSRARRAGLPVWLARAIEASLGADAAAELFAAQLEPAPIAVYRLEGGIGKNGDEACAARRASNRTGERLGADGIRDFISSGALARGEAVVSDANAQRIALAATRPGTCLEIGAGRGTKTYLMVAEAARRGLAREHVALDLYERKCALNRERLERAGLDAGVRFVAGDATDLDTALAALDAEMGERGRFDTVLLDAPCSGTGTMRRHPEIPWRLAPHDVWEALPGLQLRLLRQAARRVRAGGALIYATCSVLRGENGDVVKAFLASPEGERFEEVGCGQTHPAPDEFDGHFHAELRARG